MKRVRWRRVWIFVLGMLTFAIGFVLVSFFQGFRRSTQQGIIEDWGTMCFWYDDQGSMQAEVSPQGCYSSTCTRPVSQTGTVVIEQDKYQIRFESKFVLTETSRFPLPCTENCSGGGSVNFDLGVLQVGEYGVWFKDEEVGNLNIYSGLPTPRQCFENYSE
ncbi:MAG: hypothetical protein MUO57_09690 [Anaerolineales bacterium]|nr:hypothetical protein [Anaerolineales bacterium]